MSIQIKKKFIKSQIIDGTKVLFLNEDAFKASKSDGSEVSLFKVSSSDEFRLLQMPKVSSDPVADDDLARKKYVDDSLDVEVAAREAADETLQDNIDAEETRAQGEEARIEGKLDAEIANRIAAIVAEAAARTSADALLQDSLFAEEMARSGADNTLSTRINTEEAARIAGDAALAADLDAEEAARIAGDAALATDLDTEEAARIAGDAALESAINVEKGRVDAILLASEADKDSFAEIVQLINSVDTENDNAFASYVLSNNAALAAESAARSAADAALDARLDVVEGDATVEGSVAKAEADAKAYTDTKAAELSGDIDNLDGYAQDIRDDLDQEILDRIADVNAEETRALAAELALQSEIDAEELARAAADSAEQAARIAGDNALAADLDAEEAARIAGDAALQTSLNTEVANRISAVSAEAAAREAADDVLDAKIDQKYSDAVSYTDTKVAALVNSAPEVLDTLKELADALAGDANFATTVAGQIGAEQAAREAADAALDARLDALEGSGSGSLSYELNAFGERMVSESFVVDASMISAGYFDLGFKAFAPSMVVSLDRLMLFEGEDFVVSVVSGVTRLTFAGSILPMGDEALAAGDKIKVRYLKDVR